MPMMQAKMPCMRKTNEMEIALKLRRHSLFNIQGSLSEGKRFPSHWLSLNLPKAKYKSLCLPGKILLRQRYFKMYLLFLLLQVNLNVF